MFGRSLLIAFVLVGAAAVISANPTPLKITVESASPVYRVSVTFPGEADGTTNIQLPDEWGGQRELHKAIRNLAAAKGVKLSDTDKPFVKTISHKPGQKVTVTYEIVQDFTGPLKNAVRYRPVTDAGYIHWIGNTVWILPDWDDQTDTDIAIEWKGFPKAWTMANSFGTAEKKQRFKAKLSELRSAIFVAGVSV